MMKIYLLWFSVLFTVQNMTQIFQYHCCNQAKTYIFNMIKKCQQQKYHKQQSEDYMTSTSIRLHFASNSLFFYQLLTTGKLCFHIFVPNSLQNGHFQFCSSYTCHIVPCRHPHFNLCTMKLFFSSFIKMF